jgi:predicted site-specific integrase-resolvase
VVSDSIEVQAPRYLNSKETAALLQVSVWTVISWRRRGLGPAYFKFEGIVRYRPDDVEAFRVRCRREGRDRAVV